MTSRAGVLAGLERELRHARDTGEDGYIRELEAEIAKYSAGTTANPLKETTTAAAPAATRPARSKST